MRWERRGDDGGDNNNSLTSLTLSSKDEN